MKPFVSALFLLAVAISAYPQAYQPVAGTNKTSGGTIKGSRHPHRDGEVILKSRGSAQDARHETLFDDGWKFFKGT